MVLLNSLLSVTHLKEKEEKRAHCEANLAFVGVCRSSAEFHRCSRYITIHHIAIGYTIFNITREHLPL